MKIKSIGVKNFTSFKCEKIDFPDLALLVGANASGKSNTISLLRFINNIILYGLANAISLLGGINYAVNVSLGRDEPITVFFELDFSDEKWIMSIKPDSTQRFALSKIICDFEIQPHKKGQGYIIKKDFLEVTYTSVDFDPHKKLRRHYDKQCIITFQRHNNGPFKQNIVNQTSLADEEIKSGIGSDFLVRIMNDKENKKELIFSKLYYFVPPIFSNGFVKIYDFDPKLLKKSCAINSINSLEEDGSNLAFVLQDILKTKSTKRKLNNILSDTLPFIKDIAIESNFDKSISYKLTENYNNKEFYAQFLSDGTVNILALIVAFYFSKPGIIVIEEPERNIHPKLMKKIVDMAKETSINKQVIITTHNPEFVKYADLNSILFARRCKEGFTSINRPVNSQMVRTFLESELGLEDLFIQDMLGE